MARSRGQYKFVLQLWISYRDGKLAVPKEYRDASKTPLEATIDGEHTRFASALIAGESPVC